MLRSGFDRNSYSHEEKFRCGYLLSTKGRKDAIAELKRITRAKQKNSAQYYTFGFLAEGSSDFVYLANNSFRQYDLIGANKSYRAIKSSLESVNWQVKQGQTARLNEHYKVNKSSITDDFLTIDCKKPKKFRCK